MIPVRCKACETDIGECDLDDPESVASLDRLAIEHDQTCTATPEQKHAAALVIEFKMLQEGL